MAAIASLMCQTQVVLVVMLQTWLHIDHYLARWLQAIMPHLDAPQASVGSSMPDEFFLPMGGSMGPQMTSSRFSQNSPPYYGPPQSQGNSGHGPPGSYYPAGGYFPTIEEVDSYSDIQYTWWDMCVNLFAVGTYLADVGTDLFVAYLHFHNGDWWWFSLTLAFVLVPSLIITSFSLAWYHQDHLKRRKHNKDKQVKEPTVSYVRWVSRFLFHMLQLGPVIRYESKYYFPFKYIVMRKLCVCVCVCV